MRLAVDLHVHSGQAGGASESMTLPTIAWVARRKGVDVIGTGDCLQPDRLREIQVTLVETGSGFLTMRLEAEEACRQTLPPRLRRPLHFVLSTEVCCAPAGTPRFGGLHHLIYFRSIESVRRFQSRVASFGDLRVGRPSLGLSSKELLALVIEHGDGCELAPAHVLSPWYSTLGSVSGGTSIRDVFGDLASRLLAVEMGATSTPLMCRRISALDACNLFCCSDAHSPGRVGREYTLLDIEPSYAALMSALRDPSSRHIRGFVKFPVEFAGYYRNYCGVCRRAFDGTICLCCGRRLTIGSHDRLETIADRRDPRIPPGAPPVRQLLPLIEWIALFMGVGEQSEGVKRFHGRLIDALGHERYILTEAPLDEICAASTLGLARVIVAQRSLPPRYGIVSPTISHSSQLSWDF